jgi:hypothetical protein
LSEKHRHANAVFISGRKELEELNSPGSFSSPHEHLALPLLHCAGNAPFFPSTYLLLSTTEER